MWSIFTPLLAQYVAETDEQTGWQTTCASNIGSAIHKVEYADFGITFQDKYVRFMAENIVCAMLAIHRANVGSDENIDFDYYKDTIDGMVNNYYKTSNDLRKEPKYADLSDTRWNTLYFSAYFSIIATDLLTEEPVSSDKKDLSDAILRCLQTTNVRWGGSYNMSLSSITYNEQMQRELNQSLMNIAVYNRKAKGVAFYRPQISRKNIKRVSIGASVLVVSLIFWKVWGNK